jgi:transcriptional regulator with XRE-family HTH domain
MNEYPWGRRHKSSRKPTARDKEIGQRIRWCRHLKGMTLATLAEAIGISPQQLAKYETGQNKVDASSLELIAKLFQVAAEKLARGFSFEPALNEVGLGLCDLLHDPLVIRLLHAWGRIERSEHRDLLLRLINSFDQTETAPPKRKMQPS